VSNWGLGVQTSPENITEEYKIFLYARMETYTFSYPYTRISVSGEICRTVLVAIVRRLHYQLHIEALVIAMYSEVTSISA
jgi:hypothetical protein